MALAAILVACGSASPSPSPSPSPATPSPSPATPSPSPSPSSPAGAAYELHEWGVVDVPESGPVEISAGAGQPQRPMSVRKPVVYAHLLDGAAEQTFGLRVTLGAGSFVEHDPAGTLAGTTLEWPHVVARAAHCAPAAPGSARRAAPGCGTTDGVCEVTELPRYDAPSAACLDVDGTQTALLFYRAQVPSVTLPVDVTRAADLTVSVTGTAAVEHVPGGMMRLSTALSGPWPQGRVVVARAGLPSTGQTVMLPVGTEAITRAQGMDELRRILVALGLTDDEASAFLNGWADELFGADTGPQRDATREATRWAASPGPRRQDVLLFFLPASSIDGIATLAATPAPRAVHRAMLVRIDLGAVPTG